MSERVLSEKDLVRRAGRRLAVLRHAREVSGNVAATCRYYGISRNVFYRWKAPVRGRGPGGSQGPLQRPAPQPGDDPSGSDRQDHPPAAALPLRPPRRS